MSDPRVYSKIKPQMKFEVCRDVNILQPRFVGCMLCFGKSQSLGDGPLINGALNLRPERPEPLRPGRPHFKI